MAPCQERQERQAQWERSFCVEKSTEAQGSMGPSPLAKEERTPRAGTKRWLYGRRKSWGDAWHVGTPHAAVPRLARRRQQDIPSKAEVVLYSLAPVLLSTVSMLPTGTRRAARRIHRAATDRSRSLSDLSTLCHPASLECVSTTRAGYSRLLLLHWAHFHAQHLVPTWTLLRKASSHVWLRAACEQGRIAAMGRAPSRRSLGIDIHVSSSRAFQVLPVVASPCDGCTRPVCATPWAMTNMQEPSSLSLRHSTNRRAFWTLGHSGPSGRY
ncbi:hypothetical protein COCMIDRAFT_29100 [Bipolaris oryzae ATCC 44560]|uniref:Uncharacterized protein n=1 Tax=Bipolaris oryzae ATCC 44560 TaxID=930090 RepID=W6YXG8_COCMI|nr:uncharacterized protein COCMIDRAFT_29100 [Bipolaris oryzae ATCC 44560]EUC42233.1 hypothetical protein COCMIDRAFT_29100 [Bipolaris oryzae ATCC 44560]